MKPHEKLKLIEEISKSLSVFKKDQVEYLLGQYGYYPYHYGNSYSTSELMAYSVLKEFSEVDLFRIAADQEIEINSTSLPPSPFLWKQGYFKIFLSHSSKDKESANKIKKSLEPWGIDVFVAHQDIKPSEEWRQEIIRALGSMDAFMALLTPDFKKSDWTDQEFGIAFNKKTVIIPLIYGLNPYGFMGATQGTKIKGITPEIVSKSICQTLLSKNQTKEKLVESLFNIVLSAQSLENFERGLEKIRILKDELGLDSFSILRERILDNTFFNQPNWITTFNQTIISTFNNQIEFISKKAFTDRHLKTQEDDPLPF